MVSWESFWISFISCQLSIFLDSSSFRLYLFHENELEVAQQSLY